MLNVVVMVQYMDSESLPVTAVAATITPLWFYYQHAEVQSDPRSADHTIVPLFYAKSKWKGGVQSQIIKSHCVCTQLVEVFGGPKAQRRRSLCAG